MVLEKIVSRNKLKVLCTNARKNNQRIVFTNGCFDILHVGHVRYLREAKSLGDILVVGINNDSSVRLIKGQKRPIIPEKERAEILACLFFVDYVCVFPETDPLNLIKAVRPHLLVKGSDWAKDRIIGADFVRSYGGKVITINLTPGASTTTIIKVITERYC